MSRNVIVFHKGCTDGTCCAAIVTNFLGKDEEIIYYPMSYNTPMDMKLLTEDTILWVLDYSFHPTIWMEIADSVNKILWFDHHETVSRMAMTKIANNLESHFNNTIAACEVVWKELYPDQKMPMAVQMCGDRDMWKFRFAETRPFTEALYYTMIEPTHKDWKELLHPTIYGDYNSANIIINTLIDKGKGLLDAKQIRIDKAISRGYYGTILGEKCFYVNSSEDISEIGEEIYLSHQEPIVAAIYYYHGVSSVKVSLRSNQINVRKIAEHFEGGGHDFAAAFTLEVENKPLRTILKDKTWRVPYGYKR